jgi:phosphoribosylformylglycinamidine synthase subunit PurQ / glutaminase
VEERAEMVKPRILVMRVAGTNCDRETEWAFMLAGGLPERVHINRIKRGEVRMKDYQALVIPGGFSYGDDISAGRVLANEIKYNIGGDIRDFIGEDKPVIGICNGFQVLVKSGILPYEGRQSVTLGWNDSARFEDRWVYLKIEESVSPFLKGMPPVIRLPVAHAEGRLITEDEDVLRKIQDDRLVIFRYCGPDGSIKGYPYNPNGSMGSIAGLTSPNGLVLGMMPHPERAVSRHLFPDWHRDGGNTEETGYGYIFFKNVVNFFK